MGKPRRVNLDGLPCVMRGGSIPGEVKHLSTQRNRNSIDSVSSGERTRRSLNFTFVDLSAKWRVIGIIHLKIELCQFRLVRFNSHKELQIEVVAERPWNSRP